MDNVSKVIFICLAIGFTLLTYQNNEQQKDIDRILESYQSWKETVTTARDVTREELGWCRVETYGTEDEHSHEFTCD